MYILFVFKLTILGEDLGIKFSTALGTKIPNDFHNTRIATDKSEFIQNLASFINNRQLLHGDNPTWRQPIRRGNPYIAATPTSRQPLHLSNPYITATPTSRQSQHPGNPYTPTLITPALIFR